mmetsp:Transcript_8271/g.19568  ORF Transcript_8271/g.19568 Transcript_8271/m.19568 type:complete len:216 (-) Transcript_8271:577-1224(-)
MRELTVHLGPGAQHSKSAKCQCSRLVRVFELSVSGPVFRAETIMYIAQYATLILFQLTECFLRSIWRHTWDRHLESIEHLQTCNSSKNFLSVVDAETVCGRIAVRPETDLATLDLLVGSVQPRCSVLAPALDRCIVSRAQERVVDPLTQEPKRTEQTLCLCASQAFQCHVEFLRQRANIEPEFALGLKGHRHADDSAGGRDGSTPRRPTSIEPFK